jgi:cell wall-associated NlpC family hydrolase
MWTPWNSTDKKQNFMKTLSLSLALLLLTAMPMLHAEPPVAAAEEEVATLPGATAIETERALNALARDALVNLAIELLDTTYRYGGNSPLTGLDCSGLVSHVYEQAAGIALPRSSRVMARSGEQVDTGALLPGDVLFFARPRKPVSHVGIYIGDGLFIHAASKSKRVKLSEIDQRYYLTRLVGARRYLPQ